MEINSNTTIPRFKVRVNPLQSKAIQGLVLALGGQWHSRVPEAPYMDNHVLYYNTAMTFSVSTDHVLDQPYQEYTFVNLAVDLLYRKHRMSRATGVIPKFKVRVNVEQSRQIQELIFALGGEWAGGETGFNFPNSPYLYFDNYIYTGLDDQRFDESLELEYDTGELIVILENYKQLINLQSEVAVNSSTPFPMVDYLDRIESSTGNGLDPLPEPLSPVWSDVDNIINDFKKLLGY